MEEQRQRGRLIMMGVGAFIVIDLIIVALYVLNVFAPPEDTVELVNTFESDTSVSFAYPDGWQHVIPAQNIIFVADEAVLNQEAGASMTIQRNLRLTSEAESLDDALALFLERGPLAPGKDWTVIESAQSGQLGARESLTAILEGAEGKTDPRLHSEVTITRADNGILYVFAFSAPLETWSTSQPLFDAILDSVVIHE